MRILAVDDDPIILDFLCDPDVLGGTHVITPVSCAADALRAIAEADTPFDALLIDIYLPGQNGMALCGAVRKLNDYDQTPIVIMTASNDVDLIQEAFSAGATDFVRKPFDGLELLTRVLVAETLADAVQKRREAQIRVNSLSVLLTDAFSLLPPQSAQTGLLRYMELENRLLTAPQGCHALHLFHIMVPHAERTPKPQEAEAFAADLRAVASAALSSGNHKMDLAYAGHGLFVGVTYGRRSESMSALQINIVKSLIEAGQDRIADGITCGSISGTRVWTSRTAVAAVRHFVNVHADCSGSGDVMDDELFEVA
ncbi:response regulator [Loktanella sp. TSTF-M6]|uniref:Response regulator n=1 Tax=Loktanella gaetbuli TaxID=2881335 RepID=A0ABS8BXB2_9RHOB|nr:response regulator [Loktanella gaetbuli]MCB5200378.1 response regulator [Loktanella gaetbuli]